MTDRAKGYFPVPALVSLEGPVLTLVADALTSRRAMDRGIWNRERSRRCCAPRTIPTPAGASQLWQVGLLEIWLQRHGL